MLLSANSLKNKRIGLLEDKRSESGYLAPMSELKQFGHELDNAQLVFYPNRESLVNDFLAEKLDIIPSVGHRGQLKRWPYQKRCLYSMFHRHCLGISIINMLI